MKRLAILTFSLGVMVAPFQAHAQKPVEFNGMVFDSAPVQGYEAPKAQAPVQRAGPRVGRNDPCPCGSGKKYKKCHLPLEEGGAAAE